MMRQSKVSEPSLSAATGVSLDEVLDDSAKLEFDSWMEVDTSGSKDKC